MLKIGPYEINQPYILAPMAGVSQMPFRRLALQMGAGLAPTELISAKGLFFANQRTKSYLTYDQKVEKPFCVQLFGGEPESMGVAAEKAMSMGAQIIDINMGCPVKKVTKTNAGSALLCDYRRAQSIVRAMRQATGYQIPITAKIRSGWDSTSLNYLDVAKALQDEGISAIALHARTRAQGYSGLADWEHIATLKRHLAIPVIGNGDIKSFSDVEKMRTQTGCDAFMIGRAALGNPWIFKEFLQKTNALHISGAERLATVEGHFRDHLALHQTIADLDSNLKRELAIQSAVRSFRSHLIWYSKGLSGGAKFRQLVMTTECAHKTLDMMQEFFVQSNKSGDCFELCDDGVDYRQAFG